MLFRFLIVLVMHISSVGWASEVRVAVRGMVCGFCAQGITKKFSALEEIEKVDVSLEKAQVKFTVKDGFILTDAKIIDLLRDSGFAPGKIERN